MRWSCLACCVALCGCGNQLGSTNNVMAPRAAASSYDSNILTEPGDDMNDADANGYAILSADLRSTPQGRKEMLARRAREDKEAERFDQWRARVLPTPHNAFPKIGACYQGRIKELSIYHQRISDGSNPDDAGIGHGATYDSYHWTWEKHPVRQDMIITIPFGGYILYSNGLEQSFDHETWNQSEPPPFAASRVGDKVTMCVVAHPDHCPPGDFRGIVYRTTDLRTGRVWEQGDSQHLCGGQ